MGLFDFAFLNCWKALKNSDKPIVLYGMGNGADKVLDEMEKRDIKAAGVMASDGFVRHQSFRGFTVRSERELVEEFSDFTVALCFGSALPEVMEAIEAVAQRHELIAPNVPVIGTEVMDDIFLEKNKEKIEHAYALLADKKSKAVFEGTLAFCCTGRLTYLKQIESTKDEAFDNILRLKDECYLDLGAYRGDTVEEFLRYSDGYTHITAVEPNPKNFIKLKKNTEGILNVTLLNMGISDKAGRSRVTLKSGRMAALCDSGESETQVTTVDRISCAPTYIKADVEGYEAKMLLGARNTLKTKPKLNIAAYHRTADFFELILQIRSMNPDYRIYLRKHPYIPCWDLNLYAV